MFTLRTHARHSSRLRTKSPDDLDESTGPLLESGDEPDSLIVIRRRATIYAGRVNLDGFRFRLAERL
jgi:hypothetical protein